MQLSEKELKLLKACSKEEKRLDEIAKEIGLDYSSCYWAYSMLYSKKLVAAREEVSIFFEKSEEAQRYLKELLPELRVIKKLKQIKRIKVNEAKDFFKEDELNFGIQWALKKGFLRIVEENKEKFFELTKEGEEEEKEMKEQKEFEKVFENKAKKEKVEEFKKRNLIIEKTKRVVFLRITEEGEEEKKRMENLNKKIVTSLNREIINRIKKGEEFEFKKYDLSCDVAPSLNAREHPFTYVANWVKEILVSLGFEEEVYPVLETNFWNCDVLFMPSKHPARGIHDIFFLKNKEYVEEEKEKNKKIWEMVKKVQNGYLDSKGWGYWDENLAKRAILRSQTTAVSARVLAKLKDFPRKVFTIDLVYRPDSIDATHLPEFHQCEGIVVAKNANFKHLLGYIELIAKELGVKEIKFFPAFFPFTEPSVSGYIKHEKLGWIEALPGGIFRKEVTRALGIKANVLAWGLGIDRLAMVALDISDIREIFSSNIDYLRNYRYPKL
ncbi:MAG: phenylalanine--tRNA ligase subunit alpha [Candidatus Micrarchaeales archaeon]